MPYLPNQAELQNMYAKINFKVEHELDHFYAHHTAVSGEIKLKVFSNLGTKDMAAGNALRDYLVAHGVAFTSNNPRVVFMQGADFKKLFGEVAA
jgi:hypothetical protein